MVMAHDKMLAHKLRRAFVARGDQYLKRDKLYVTVEGENEWPTLHRASVTCIKTAVHHLGEVNGERLLLEAGTSRKSVSPGLRRWLFRSLAFSLPTS